MKALIKIFAFILIFSGVLIGVHYVLSSFFHKDTGLLLHHGIGQLTFYILFVLLVFIFQTYINRQRFLSLGLEPYSGWYVTLLKGWMTGVIAFTTYTILTKLFGVIDLQTKWSTERVLVAVMVAFSAFGIALTEEILFRGFFLQTFLKDLPVWISVVITGIVFIFFHDLTRISSFWKEPRQMMLAGGLFSLNILLCVAYLKSKALWLPIGIHSGLVYAKVFFMKMRLIQVVDPNSYLFGLGGDARRGFLAWVLFLSGILILNLLISDRERKRISL